MACPDQVIIQAAAFAGALTKTRTVRIDADWLELRSDDGALRVHALRK